MLDIPLVIGSTDQDFPILEVGGIIRGDTEHIDGVYDTVGFPEGPLALALAQQLRH